MSLEQPECPICYQKKEEMLNISCQHSFCPECLHKWTEQHNTCPLCREIIDPLKSSPGVFVLNVLETFEMMVSLIDILQNHELERHRANHLAEMRGTRSMYETIERLSREYANTSNIPSIRNVSYDNYPN